MGPSQGQNDIFVLEEDAPKTPAPKDVPAPALRTPHAPGTPSAPRRVITPIRVFPAVRRILESSPQNVSPRPALDSSPERPFRPSFAVSPCK